MVIDLKEPTEDVPTEPRRHSRVRGIVEWILVLVVAVTLSFLVRTYAFQEYSIPSGSMLPTLDINDRIMVNKLAVDFGTINVGDIVVFKAPPDVKRLCNDAVTDLVKRVIGTPGDVLNTVGNTIYIDGKKLHQHWSHYPSLGVDGAIHHFTVPAGQYFMMGDNHADSCDSRTWGTVPRADIIGKVFMKIWPLSHMTWY